MIRISIPSTAREGEIVEIKAMIQHPMETGYRRDARGEVIPRDIINHFKCTYDGRTIFEARLYPGTAANPFLTFCTRATQTGTLEFTWTDQAGETWSATRELIVA